MIDVNTNKCCGCEVCADACPFSAITMQPDGMGFKYAKVDLEKCTKCGICSKICPFESNVFNEETTSSVYEARHKDSSEVKTSRSGAAFVALSDIFLENGGVVYGAATNKELQVCHLRVTTKKERDFFKGSKYIQSKTSGIYKEVKSDLQHGLPVMFVGTPCQCAALSNYLPQSLKSNLVTIDMVCHGVASAAVWADFLNMVETKEKGKIVSVNFRDKEIYGWSGLHRESFILSTGKKIVMPFTYYQSFLLRPSCHSCPFAREKRVSDITLGDFWNWKQSGKIENSDDLGVSMIMCNSTKGIELIKLAARDLILNSIDLVNAIQPNLIHPTEEDPLRSIFEKDYIANGFEYVRHKYYKVSPLTMLKYYIKRLIVRS